MSNKKYKIMLTKAQIYAVTQALYEYAGICEDECQVSGGVVDGYETCKPNKRSAGYHVAKRLDKINQTIHRQFEKARGEK